MGVAAFLFWESRSPLDLRDALARAFGRNPELIFPNLPPRFGRYPGAVVYEGPGGQSYLVRVASRPEPQGDGVHLAADVQGSASALLGTEFGPVAQDVSSAGTAKVHLNLDGLRVFEVPLPELARSLRDDEAILRARENGRELQVVVAAYEATPTLEIRETTQLTAEQRASLREVSVRSGGKLEGDGTIVIKGRHPVVVAYELATVRFVAGQFGPGGEIELAPLEFEKVQARSPGVATSTPSGKDVLVVTVDVGEYRSRAFGSLRSSGPSATLFRSVLSRAGAHTEAPAGGTVTSTALNAALDRIADTVKTRRPDLLVFYYVGHSVATADGDLLLVLSDYIGDGANLRTSRSGGPSALEVHLQAGNLGDLERVARELAPPSAPPGTERLSSLHGRLSALGVPFAVVMDGCAPVDRLAELRRTLQLTDFGDYYGPSEVPIEEIRRYRGALEQFGAAGYLHSRDVVVFGARPGSVALETDTPLAEGIGEKVGPLAARAARMLPGYFATGEAVSWGEFLRSLADPVSTGEMRVRGMASWSDFTALEGIPMLGQP